MPNGAFVSTSNVDGQCQKAGWPEQRIVECHGSIHHLQCAHWRTDDTWSAEGFAPVVDEASGLLTNEPPGCPHCGGLARPNILMFGDASWLSHRAALQRRSLEVRLSRVERGVVIESGAGTAIPTVRMVGEETGWPTIRINPREPNLDSDRGVSLALGALDAIQQIGAALGLK